MAGFTASWVHGSAVIQQQSPNEDFGVFYFNHFGWGTQIIMRPGMSHWFHIAIPTPVFLDGSRLKLIRAFLQWEQIAGYPRSGYVQDAHLWDARTCVGRLSNKDFKQSGYATIPGHSTYELRKPRLWEFGVGLSFRLSALPMVSSHWVNDGEAPVIVIGSAGADFEV